MDDEDTPEHSAHAIITGGSDGIGYAVASVLGAQGFTLTLVARRADGLAAACERLSHRVGARAGWEACDVSDEIAVRAAIKRAQDRRGPCHTLVTAAGMVIPGAFEDLDPEAFARQMDVNFFGTVNTVRAVYPEMVERGAGRIVMVCSAAALVGIYGYTAYGASKFAVRGFAEALRGEARVKGVSVSLAFPGDTDTQQYANEIHERPAETSAIAGKAALSPPDFVARAIVRGMDRGTFAIYPNLQTRALGRTASLIAPILQRRFDATVRAVRRK
ncbi:MAG: SDR family oxidoreductase [Pseudomonadota bacterium]